MKQLRAENETVEAEIRWLGLAEGGRKSLPTVREYRSIVRFEDDPNAVLGTWDVRVEFLDEPTLELPNPSRLGFVSADAPRQLLHSGSRFELTEGRKVVAHGVVRP